MDDILQTLSVYSVLLPLLTGLIFWKLQDANARIMILLLAFASVSQLIGSQSEENRNLIYNLYILTDVFFWSLLFFRNTKARPARVLIFSLFMLVTAIAVITFISKGINNEFYSYLVCFDSAIQVICVLIYFYEKYHGEKIIRLADDSMFWFCLAILFYAPCTYFLFVYRSVQGSVPGELWNYHHVLNFLLYMIISIGFLVRYKTINTLFRWI